MNPQADYENLITPKNIMSTRPRPASSLPKPPATLAPTATIADTAVLTGKHPVTVQAGTILHPRARLVSTHGPVTVGEGCVVSERAIVGVAPPEAGAEVAATVLRRDVVLEPAAVVEAGAQVGEGSVLEAGSRVGAGAVLGKVGCFPKFGDQNNVSIAVQCILRINMLDGLVLDP